MPALQLTQQGQCKQAIRTVVPKGGFEVPSVTPILNSGFVPP
jgi:hypothetical protein